VEVKGDATVLTRSPDDVSGEAADTIVLKAPVRVTGASTKPSTASPQDLLMPADSNWLQTPFLKLTSASGSGWSSPYDISFDLTPLDAANLGKAGWHGLVRTPFLGDTSPLRDLAPKAGETVVRVAEDGDTVQSGALPQPVVWNPPDTVVFESEGRALVAYDGAGFSGLTSLGATERRHLVVEGHRPRVQKAQLADLDGDGIPEWLVEVVQLSGDGYTTTLWIVPGTGMPHPVALGASSGESGGSGAVGTWYFDREQRLVWVVRAQPEAVHAVRVRYSRSRVEELKGAAYGVEARGAPRLAISRKGAIAWVNARLFATEKEARAAGTGPSFVLR
jgi:hypothetical protein